MKTLPRRTLLRGLGGLAIGLPFLEAMRPSGARADDAAPPKRVLFMFTPNGRPITPWRPTSVGASFDFPAILKPLDTDLLRDKVTVVSGLHNAMATQLGYEGGNGHARGMSTLLTGCRWTESADGDAGSFGWGGGISIDQELGKRIAQPGQIASLPIGAACEAKDPISCFSYGDGGGSFNAVASDGDPRNVFERVFGNVPDLGESTAEAEYRLAQRRSVLDHVRGDFDRVQAHLGQADRERLTRHAEEIAALQARLVIGAACQKPAPPEVSDNEVYGWPYPEVYEKVGKLQMDLLAQALICDRARVGCMQFSIAQSVINFPFVPGPEDGHHNLSHAAPYWSQEGDMTGEQAAVYDKLTGIVTYYTDQLAYLGSKLAAAQEADGSSVLDNTAIVWLSEVAGEGQHGTEDMLCLILGGLGGSLRSGHIDLGNARTTNDLFLTLAQALGQGDLTTFGEPEYCSGPIGDLLV